MTDQSDRRARTGPPRAATPRHPCLRGSLATALAALLLLVLPARPLPAADSGPDGSFGPGGARVLDYDFASSMPPDQALALLRDSQGRSLAIVSTRDPFPLGSERALNLVLFRHLPSGAADPSFGFQGAVQAHLNWSAFGMAMLDSQDRIVVVGRITDNSVPARSYTVLRLRANGSLDPTFNGGSGNVGIVAFDVDGGPGLQSLAVARFGNDDLLFAGIRDGGDILLRKLSGINGVGVDGFGIGFGFQLLRFQPVAAGAIDTVAAVATLPDGRSVVLGQSCTAALGCRPAAARLTANGALDASFCASPACIASSAPGSSLGRRVVQHPTLPGWPIDEVRIATGLRDGAGRLLLAGGTELAGSTLPAPALVLRLGADGDIDAGFGAAGSPGFQALALPDAPLLPLALALDPSQRLVLAAVSERSGLRRSAVARLTGNGAPDLAFTGNSAIAEYFASPAGEDRSLAAVLAGSDRILALGDFNRGAERKGFLLRLGGELIFSNGFQAP